MEYFDCAACEKEHEFDPVVGDVHYDRRSGKSYVYDGVDWKVYHPFSSSSSTMTWTSGPLGPTTPSTSLPFVTPPTPFKHDDIFIEDRRSFVAEALKDHELDTLSGDCKCGFIFQMSATTNEFRLHIADVAVTAADEWDERQMEGEDG